MGSFESIVTIIAAVANAAMPIITAAFLPSFFFAALHISAASATATAAAARAIPNDFHNHESS